MKDFLNKYIFNDTVQVIIDHTILITVVFTALNDQIGIAIAGLAIYFIGQHPRYLSSK